MKYLIGEVKCRACEIKHSFVIVEPLNAAINVQKTSPVNITGKLKKLYQRVEKLQTIENIQKLRGSMK